MNEETEDLKNMIIHLVGLAEENYNEVFFEKVDNAGAEIMNRLDELQAFKDKQEQGLLIELPCKVGDKVWFIRTSNVKPELVETEIEKVVLKKRGLYVQLSCNSFYETSCNSIGKTVFFTEAEAEEALEKMGGANEDTD